MKQGDLGDHFATLQVGDEVVYTNSQNEKVFEKVGTIVAFTVDAQSGNLVAVKFPDEKYWHWTGDALVQRTDTVDNTVGKKAVDRPGQYV